MRSISPTAPCSKATGRGDADGAGLRRQYASEQYARHIRPAPIQPRLYLRQADELDQPSGSQPSTRSTNALTNLEPAHSRPDPGGRRTSAADVPAVLSTAPRARPARRQRDALVPEPARKSRSGRTKTETAHFRLCWAGGRVRAAQYGWIALVLCAALACGWLYWPDALSHNDVSASANPRQGNSAAAASVVAPTTLSTAANPPRSPHASVRVPHRRCRRQARPPEQIFRRIEGTRGCGRCHCGFTPDTSRPEHLLCRRNARCTAIR